MWLLPLRWPDRRNRTEPEWRNWYTHQTQNLARFTPHESSSLSSGTNIFKGLAGWADAWAFTSAAVSL